MEQKTGIGFSQAISIISPELKMKLSQLPQKDKKEIFDIRLRISKPVILIKKNEKVYLQNNSTCSNQRTGEEYICTEQIINDTFNRLCCFSVHSHLSQLIKGYVTISGGHRAAVTGTAVYGVNGEIISIKNISSISIRIAREVIGCSDNLFSTLFKKGQAQSIIIAGPPCSGKTTILRDMARRLSEKLFTVCVIDERQEIAAMNNGLATMDLGPNSDILDNFAKKDATDIAVRTLSPEIIVIDEVSTNEEINAIKSAVNSGVKFIVTVHASDFNEIVNRQQIVSLINTYSFSKLVLLKKHGEYEIYDTRDLHDEIIRRNADLVELDSDWVPCEYTA